MIIDKKFKPSHHKANARYRGVTEHSQYTNFVQESAHDLLLLSHIKTGNEHTGRIGHTGAIYGNFVAVMNGSENMQQAKLFSAALMQKIDKSRKIVVPQLESWQVVNEAGAGSNPDKPFEVMVFSMGLKDPAGVAMSLYVEQTDNLYIRFQVRSDTGAPAFSFGSNTMRINANESGDTKKMNIPATEEVDDEWITVDHILRVNASETITLNINVHEDPDMLMPTNIWVRGVEVSYLEEQEVKLADYNSGIKPGLDELEEKINSIR